MIPAFTHNKVFFGHDFVTYQAQERLRELAIIFNPQSEPERIKEILASRQVKYILLTPESPRYESTNLPKLDLQLVFSNSQNRIYQIN